MSIRGGGGEPIRGTGRPISAEKQVERLDQASGRAAQTNAIFDIVLGGSRSSARTPKMRTVPRRSIGTAIKESRLGTKVSEWIKNLKKSKFPKLRTTSDQIKGTDSTKGSASQNSVTVSDAFRTHLEGVRGVNGETVQAQNESQQTKIDYVDADQEALKAVNRLLEGEGTEEDVLILALLEKEGALNLPDVDSTSGTEFDKAGFKKELVALLSEGAKEKLEAFEPSSGFGGGATDRFSAFEGILSSDTLSMLKKAVVDEL